jgi:SAM-dependent methyltransferase
MPPALRAMLNHLRRAYVNLMPKRNRTRLQTLYRPLVALAYRGSGVECPCCGGTFRQFSTKYTPDGPLRPNARCPACGAMERHRLMLLFLRNETDLLSEDRALLHFAPEPGLEALFKDRPALRYLTADLDAPPAMMAVDVQSMPFEGESYDAVICNHVLEHVPDDRGAMAEILRVLKPGGWAILGVPLDTEREHTYEDPAITTGIERERAFGQWDHVRIYGRDYAERLADSGFDVQIRPYAQELDAATVARHGLLTNDEIYVCRRPATATPEGQSAQFAGTNRT